jgi:hypothetical protein
MGKLTTIFMHRLSGNLGASTSWNPKDMSTPDGYSFAFAYAISGTLVSLV